MEKARNQSIRTAENALQLKHFESRGAFCQLVVQSTVSREIRYICSLSMRLKWDVISVYLSAVAKAKERWFEWGGLHI